MPPLFKDGYVNHSPTGGATGPRWLRVPGDQATVLFVVPECIRSRGVGGGGGGRDVVNSRESRLALLLANRLENLAGRYNHIERNHIYIYIYIYIYIILHFIY